MPGTERHPVQAVPLPAVAASRLPLTAPGGLSAGDGLSAHGVDLTWDPVEGATGYEVWRHMADDPTTATRLAGLLTTTTYRDTSAVPEILYSYWVRARNASATSDFSVAGTGWRRLPLPTGTPVQIPGGRP